MIKIGVLVLALFATLPASAEKVTLVSVYDGDTIRVNVEGWPPIVGESMPVRIRGVDTPEIRGGCPVEKLAAVLARDYLRDRLTGAADTLELRNIERGKYFRLVADVYIQDTNIIEELIGLGLGRPYDGGRRLSWCAEDDLM